MAIDPNIALGVRPVQIADPMEQYGKVLTLRGLVNQGAVQDMQLRELEDKEKTRNTLRDVVKNAGRMEDVPSALMAAGLPTEALAFQKNLTEQKKTGLEVTDLQGKIDERGWKLEKDRTTAFAQGLTAPLVKYKELVGNGMPAEVARQTVQPLYESAAATLRGSRLFTEQQMQGLPAQFDPQWTEGNLMRTMDYDKVLDNIRGDAQFAETMRNNKRQNELTAAGQSQQMTIAQMTDKRQREANAVSAATANLQQQKLNLELQQAGSQKEGAVASFNTALTTLDRLVGNGKKPNEEGYIGPHPGLSAAVGAGVGKTLLPFVGPIPGTDRADFAAQLETLKAQTFLPMVEKLKGMGALSDAEGKKLNAAVGALDANMSERDFKASAEQIRRDLVAARDRVSRQQVPQPSNRVGGVLTQNPDGSFNYGF